MKFITFFFGCLIWLYGVKILSIPGIPAGESLPPSGIESINTLLRSIFSMTFGSFLIARFCVDHPPFKRIPISIMLVGVVGIIWSSWGGTPWLDNHIYRYMWDGSLYSIGLQPHTLAPDASPVIPLPFGMAKLISYKHFPSIYPPLSICWFSILFRIFGPHPEYWFYTHAFFSIVGIFLTMSWGFKLNSPPWLIVLIILNPIWFKEFADSGHVEILAYDMVIASFLGMHTIRSLSGKKEVLGIYFFGILLGLAILVNTTSITWLMFAPYSNLRKRLNLYCSAIVTIILCGLLYFDGYQHLSKYLNSISLAVNQGIFNPGFTDLLNSILSELYPKDNSWTLANVSSRGLAFLLLICGWVWFLRDKSGKQGTITLWSIGLFMAITPALYSWNMVFLYPALIQLPWKRSPIVSLWSTACFYTLIIQSFIGYTYWAFIMDQQMIRRVTWLFFYFILFFSLWRMATNRRNYYIWRD